MPLPRLEFMFRHELMKSTLSCKINFTKKPTLTGNKPKNKPRFSGTNPLPWQTRFSMNDGRGRLKFGWRDAGHRTSSERVRTRPPSCKKVVLLLAQTFLIIFVFHEFRIVLACIVICFCRTKNDGKSHQSTKKLINLILKNCKNIKNMVYIFYRTNWNTNFEQKHFYFIKICCWIWWD